MSIADLEKIGRAQAPVVHETQIPHGVMDVRNIQRSPSIISREDGSLVDLNMFVSPRSSIGRSVGRSFGPYVKSDHWSWLCASCMPDCRSGIRKAAPSPSQS